MNSDSEKESEDILGEPAAPISSAHANNAVPQQKTLRGSKNISRSPDDGPVQPGLNCLLISQNHMVDILFWNCLKSIPG